MSSVDREELAWAAGLFDGEGSVHPNNRGKGRWITVHLAVLMTDHATVERFARAVGVGRLGPPYRPRTRPNAKPTRNWRTTNREHFQAVVAMLWPWLSDRNKDRIVELSKTPWPRSARS